MTPSKHLASIIIVLLFLAVVASGQTLWLGTNQVSPGKIVEFTAPLTASAKWEAARVRPGLQLARGGIAVPAGFDLRKPWPILVVSVPSGGSSIGALHSYTNVAFSEGWIVVAGDGPRLPAEEDSVQWGWATLSSVLEFVTRTWPPTKQWPMACAGFSGGAKRSGTVAAGMVHEGYRVIGIFMGGCNEDFASLGLRLHHPGDRFKQVPIFLSNGGSDPIANPAQGEAVKLSMEQSGFKRIRLESYDGGHQFNNDQVAVALRWFRQPAESPR